MRRDDLLARLSINQFYITVPLMWENTLSLTRIIPASKALPCGTADRLLTL